METKDIYSEGIDKIIEGINIHKVIESIHEHKATHGSDVISVDSEDDESDDEVSYVEEEEHFESVIVDAERALLTINQVRSGYVKPRESVFASAAVQRLINEFDENDVTKLLPENFTVICEEGYEITRLPDVEPRVQVDIHNKFVEAIKSNPTKIRKGVITLLGNLRLDRARVLADRLIEVDTNLASMDLSETDALSLLEDRKNYIIKIRDHASKAAKMFEDINMKLPQAEAESGRVVYTILKENDIRTFNNRSIMDAKTKLKIRVNGAVREVTTAGTF